MRMLLAETHQLRTRDGENQNPVFVPMPSVAKAPKNLVNACR